MGIFWGSALHGNHVFTVESSKNKELYLCMESTVDLIRAFNPLSVRFEIRESAEKGKSVAHWAQVSPSGIEEISVFYVTEGYDVFVEE